MDNSFVALANLQPDLKVTPPWPPSLPERESEPPANQRDISESS